MAAAPALAPRINPLREGVAGAGSSAPPARQHFARRGGTLRRLLLLLVVAAPLVLAAQPIPPRRDGGVGAVQIVEDVTGALLPSGPPGVAAAAPAGGSALGAAVSSSRSIAPALPAAAAPLPAWLSRALSGWPGAPRGARRALSSALGVTPECAASVTQRFNCSLEGCDDLTPGYINYIEFYYCAATSGALQVLSFLLFIAWMAFLLHLVETTTNDFFCASLTLAVDALKLSPNVAGVTFLAVGNAACDVIASIAAFASNSPKVGVGTTLGAGVFVCCAVVGVVTFVADVRLARRSFVRDVFFFILTIIYLLASSLDGYINFGEAVGFIAIYVIFVVVRDRKSVV